MKTIVVALRLFLFLTLLTGIAYPLLVTGIAQVLFPSKANGSILYKDNKPIGSELIGQCFDSSEIYFSARPSAISCNPFPSGGSNLGLTSRKLKEQFDERRYKFIVKNMPDSMQAIPAEMLFASASGLDPHISPEAALMQVKRICKARNFSMEQEIRLKHIIERLTEPPQFLCLGEQRINVLLLNLEADKIR